jgi:hypothetical protein
MKFSNKRQQFEASNVTFSPSKVEAYSYGWWKFLTVINGKTIFNNAHYSPTTNRHQAKVRQLAKSHGVSLDLVLRFTNANLTDANFAFKMEIDSAKIEISNIEKSLSNNRRKKSLDTSRQAMIESLKSHIRQVEIVLHGTELKAALT